METRFTSAKAIKIGLPSISNIWIRTANSTKYLNHIIYLNKIGLHFCQVLFLRKKACPLIFCWNPVHKIINKQKDWNNSSTLHNHTSNKELIAGRILYKGEQSTIQDTIFLFCLLKEVNWINNLKFTINIGGSNIKILSSWKLAHFQAKRFFINN